MSRKSRRFTPSKWSGYLVPVMLLVLGLALLAVLVVVIASLTGWSLVS
jgi:hypothetical protein